MLKIFFTFIILIYFFGIFNIQAVKNAIFPEPQSLQPAPSEVKNKIPRNINSENYYNNQNIENPPEDENIEKEIPDNENNQEQNEETIPDTESTNQDIYDLPIQLFDTASSTDSSYLDMGSNGYIIIKTKNPFFESSDCDIISMNNFFGIYSSLNKNLFTIISVGNKAIITKFGLNFNFENNNQQYNYFIGNLGIDNSLYFSDTNTDFLSVQGAIFDILTENKMALTNFSPISTSTFPINKTFFFSKNNLNILFWILGFLFIFLFFTFFIIKIIKNKKDE
ncbi:MAG: hypothetical protein V1910_00080 [bacterium]